jgi:hypothetical protein
VKSGLVERTESPLQSLIDEFELRCGRMPFNDISPKNRPTKRNCLIFVQSNRGDCTASGQTLDKPEKFKGCANESAAWQRI